MKKILSSILIVAMMFTLALGMAESEADQAVKVAALKGPTAMGMVKLMNDNQGDYDFTIAAAIDELTPKLVKGEIDIAAVPANLASVLYNSTQGKVKVLAINTLGVLYIVENGDTVKTVEDLRGKTIYSSGKGATPEFALNYLLSENGIDPEKDVTIEFKAEHTECLTALVANEGAVAMLPQPFVTTAQMKQPNIRIALDMNDAWAQLQESREDKSALITGVVVARTDFIDQHPQAVSDFMDAYAASVSYVNENTDEAAALIGQFDIIPEAVAKLALPYCQIVYIDGADMFTQLSGYLQVLYDQAPQAVGGAMPNEAFYYQR